MYVIWNLTRACPWNCPFCCVSAVYVRGQRGREIYQKQKKSELTFAQKLEVLRKIVDKGMVIDFSGGDPLYFSEDFAVVEEGVRLLPQEKVNVSMTGCDLTEKKVELLKKVNMVEFTLDNLPATQNPFRPRGFNLSSMEAMKILVRAGVKVSAVTILYANTISAENLRGIYGWLCENGVQEWDILKYYPVGRGEGNVRVSPTEDEYLAAMDFLRGLQGSTHISFQHSLRVIEGTAKCHAAVNSIGILPDGQVTACAWALHKGGDSFEDFKIGKLPEDDLDEILERARIGLGFQNQVDFCRITGCSHEIT